MDLSAELARIAAERSARLAGKKRQREAHQRARDFGLAKRHARKLDRLRKEAEDTDDTDRGSAP